MHLKSPIELKDNFGVVQKKTPLVLDVITYPNRPTMEQEGYM